MLKFLYKQLYYQEATKIFEYFTKCIWNLYSTHALFQRLGHPVRITANIFVLFLMLVGMLLNFNI